MKLSYDPRHNIAYIRLREKTGEVETIRVSDELNVDLAPDGTVYGIELLNANEPLRAGDDGRFVVVRARARSSHWRSPRRRPFVPRDEMPPSHARIEKISMIG